MGRWLRFYCILFIALFGASSAIAADLKVAVASNFATTAEALVEVFTQQSGHKVTLLVGSSGKHTMQIQYGLAVDVFMAADAKRPTLLEQNGFALKGSRQSYAQGRLVVWSAESDFFETSSDLSGSQASSSYSVAVSIEALNAIFARSEEQIVSIANPKIAPYGLAAEQVLEALAVKPKLVFGESVAQAFQFVNGGGAQLGLLALAQVKDLDFGSYRIISEDLHAPIDQQLIIVSDSPAARQWRDFVLSKSSQSLIRSRGYRSASDRHRRSEGG